MVKLEKNGEMFLSEFSITLRMYPFSVFVCLLQRCDSSTLSTKEPV